MAGTSPSTHLNHGGMPIGGRSRIIASAAVVITLISLAAALLPALGTARAAIVVGSMMLLAGCVEVLAASFRSENRSWSIAPAIVTIFAGALVFVDPFGQFLTLVHVLIGWLVGRGLLLLVGSIAARRSVRMWMLVAAITDLSLAAIFAIGLSSYTLPIALFGLTSDMIANFAFVLAISFIATAMMLIEIAARESQLKK